MTTPSVDLLQLVRTMAPLHPTSITCSDRIVDDLGYNSVRFVELLVEVEMTFGLPKFREADCAHLTTVGDLVTLIANTATIWPGPNPPKAQP